MRRAYGIVTGAMRRPRRLRNLFGSIDNFLYAWDSESNVHGRNARKMEGLESHLMIVSRGDESERTSVIVMQKHLRSTERSQSASVTIPRISRYQSDLFLLASSLRSQRVACCSPECRALQCSEHQRHRPPSQALHGQHDTCLGTCEERVTARGARADGHQVLEAAARLVPARLLRQNRPFLLRPRHHLAQHAVSARTPS